MKTKIKPLDSKYVCLQHPKLNQHLIWYNFQILNICAWRLKMKENKMHLYYLNFFHFWNGRSKKRCTNSKMACVIFDDGAISESHWFWRGWHIWEYYFWRWCYIWEYCFWRWCHIWKSLVLKKVPYLWLLFCISGSMDLEAWKFWYAITKMFRHASGSDNKQIETMMENNPNHTIRNITQVLRVYGLC